MWHPIETAPDDGTRVLVWTRTDVEPDDISYVKGRGRGDDIGHLLTVQVGWRFQDSDWHKELIGTPTHWMPLPEPPIAPVERTEFVSPEQFSRLNVGVPASSPLDT